jgi:hypothetical protein
VNRSDLAAILSTANLIDPRIEVSPESVMTWHALVGDLNGGDVSAAIQAHYRESGARVMPADIRALVKVMHKARLEHSDRILPDADPDDVHTWLAARRTGLKALADGDLTALPAPSGEIDPKLRAALPSIFRSVPKPLAITADGGEKPRTHAPSPKPNVSDTEAGQLEAERERQLTALRAVVEAERTQESVS